MVNAQTGDYMRTVKSDAEYGFFKATWQITENDRLKQGDDNKKGSA